MSLLHPLPIIRGSLQPSISKGSVIAHRFREAFGRRMLSTCLMVAYVASPPPIFGQMGTLDNYQLIAWGHDSDGQVSNIPSGPIKSVAAGDWHGIALDHDGRIITWGYEAIMNGTPTAQGFTQVAGGQNFSLALSQDGSISAWGEPFREEIINQVPTGGGFVQIVAEAQHAAALHADGTVVVWGDPESPLVTNAPTDNGYTQVAIGQWHAVALRNDGSLVSWGADDRGQVSNTPSGTGFSAISAGFRNSIAITGDGELVVWGENSTIDGNPGVVAGAPTGSGFLRADIGRRWAAAVNSNGLMVWGHDWHGQVSTSPQSAFVELLALGTLHGYATSFAVEYENLLITGDGLKALLNRSIAVNSDLLIDTSMTVANDPTMTVRGTTFLATGAHVPSSGWSLATYDLDVDAPLTIGETDFLRVAGEARIRPNGSVTFINSGFSRLPGYRLRLLGGSLIAENGLSVRDTEDLTGYGKVLGPISAGNASTIAAVGGDLELGKASASNGFTTFGVLLTNEHVVSLLDRNGAYFGGGSLTRLGNNAQSGTLVSDSGAVIDFGATVEGFGRLDTPNNPFSPLIVNGWIEGNSVEKLIELSGFVKGVGSFDNVLFSGTHSPGFSPGRSFVGFIAYGSDATVIMEIAGLVPGMQHDQIVASDGILLDGTLKVELLGGFIPVEGDIFELFSGNLINGFDQLVLPQLPDGLFWDTSLINTTGTLSVIPEPVSLSILALGGLALLRRRAS